MRPILALPTFFACLLTATAVGADDVAELLKVIQSNETSEVDRANAFEKIGDIAGEDAVEPLAGFLSDKKWSHYARFALQKMEGESVTDALIQSLDALEGDLKLGVIDTIGRRRDPIAVSRLAKLLTNADAQIAAAAAVALGGIGTTDAAAALSEALSSEKDANRRESLASSLLLVGQRLGKTGNTQAAINLFDCLRDAEVPRPCRIGATHNAILARGARGVDLMVEQLKSSDRDFFQTGLAVSRVLPGERATKALTDLLKTESSPDRQVLLIRALKDRGDHQALRAILEKLKSDSAAAQLAAIDAIGTLGDDSSVPILLSVANAANTDAVLGSLVALKGSRVNAALMRAAEPPDTSTVAVKALGQRHAKEAAQLLLQLSAADSVAISQEAIVALGMAATQERFLDLFALLKTAKSADRKAAIQKAIHAAVSRSTQPDVCAEALGAMIPRSSGADREFLFEQVRTAGGATAVALMEGFATGSDEDLQDAATKTLGRWLSADAAPVLLQVAQEDGKFANRALGGYIRIFRQFELSESVRVAMAAKALKVARRSIERNAAIDAMTRFPCVGTFELALDQLDVPGSEATAAKAVLTIGRTVLDLDPETGEAGLKRLIDADVSKRRTDSAEALLQWALSATAAETVNPLGKTLDGWLAKGPIEKSKWQIGMAQIDKDDSGKLSVIPAGDEPPAMITPEGRGLDIYTKAKFGDSTVELEVMVPKGSNSGIYLMGEYEVQVLDSFGKKRVGPGDMGGIYGANAPRVNAAREPGTWQKYVIEFQAPRFNAEGNKRANARFIKVTLNGQVLHEDVEMRKQTPGGVTGREHPTGPLMFQGNHGPVAYRNIRITPR